MKIVDQADGARESVVERVRNAWMVARKLYEGIGDPFHLVSAGGPKRGVWMLRVGVRF